MEKFITNLTYNGTDAKTGQKYNYKRNVSKREKIILPD